MKETVKVLSYNNIQYNRYSYYSSKFSLLKSIFVPSCRTAFTKKTTKRRKKGREERASQLLRMKQGSVLSP